MTKTAIYIGGVNVRAAADLNAAALHMTNVPDFADIQGITTKRDALGFLWVHVFFDDGRPDGWTREDKTFVVGDFSIWHAGQYQDRTRMTEAPGWGFKTIDSAGATVPSVPVTPSQPPIVVDNTSGGVESALWASPTKYVKIFEGFGGGHKGVDLAGALKNKVTARGMGVVVVVNVCQKCPDGNGKAPVLNDPNVLDDPAWGYGFGNYVIVRHAWAALPLMTQETLKKQGVSNVNVFSLYAHLDTIQPGLRVGSVVGNGDALGEMGTSGNSSGPHLHLQVSWFNGPALPNTLVNIINPNWLFYLPVSVK